MPRAGITLDIVALSPSIQHSFPAWPRSVSAARHAVTDAARDLGATNAALDDIALAVSEACSNAVIHAFVDRHPGTIAIEVEATGTRLTVRVRDDGRGMLPRHDSPGLGLGLPVIASLCDAFDVRAEPGGGTTVCMFFEIGSRRLS